MTAAVEPPVSRSNDRLFVVMVLTTFYSYGTFGFLNLFGLRTAGQMAGLGLVVMAAVMLRFNVRPQVIIGASLFFGAIAVGGAFRRGAWVYPFESAVACAICILILSAPRPRVVAAAKALVAACAVTALAVAVAFLIYLRSPTLLSRANINIYDSTTGSRTVEPGSFVDYLSFTSGDGFVVAGRSVPRLKGYSNEPSATAVHYLAPVVLGLLLGGWYRLLAIGVLGVNVVAIASVASYVVVAMAAVIAGGIFVFRKLAPVAVVAGTVAALLFLLNFDALAGFQQRYGLRVIEEVGIDLLARKTDSLEIRQAGIVAGLRRVPTSPFGWTGEDAAGGALAPVAEFGGWLSLSLLLCGAVLFTRRVLAYARAAGGSMRRIVPGFALALLFVALFVSGYGWNRVPGFVIFVMVYRLLESGHQAAAAEPPAVRD